MHKSNWTVYKLFSPNR